MLTFTTPIAIPNISRWQVLKAINDPDAANPVMTVLVLIIGAGAAQPTYLGITLCIYDVVPSTGFTVNPAPLSYNDRILSTSTLVPNAYTTVAAASASAGSRHAQLLAVETALVTLGLAPPSS